MRTPMTERPTNLPTGLRLKPHWNKHFAGRASGDDEGLRVKADTPDPGICFADRTAYEPHSIVSRRGCWSGHSDGCPSDCKTDTSARTARGCDRAARRGGLDGRDGNRTTEG